MIAFNLKECCIIYICLINCDDFNEYSFLAFQTIGKTRFGMHEISNEESSVLFRLRLPKKGDYNLIIYARHTGEQVGGIPNPL